MDKTLFNPKENRILTILMGALLFGFAWQLRGSGTSDPAVVAILFVLFLSINYSPRKKFNLLTFAAIAFTFNIMRTGWGSFVSQGGLPGLDIPKVAVLNYVVDGVNQELPVSWYLGYFWMFITGISWFGIPSLLFGGYFFTKLKYTLKEVFIIAVIFSIARFFTGYIAEFLIPYLAPEYYNDVYLAKLSRDAMRSYGHMYSNMRTAMAIIPVLLYIRFIKVDKEFFKYSLIGMTFFASSLAAADIFWPIAQLLGMDGHTGWSLWEYFTGFFFGGLIFWFYGRFSDEELAETDISMGLDTSKWKPFERFVVYAFAFYRLFLHGVGESLDVVTKLSFNVLNIELDPYKTSSFVVTFVGVFLYWLYDKGKIGKSFAQKTFREQSLIALIVVLPLYYLNFTPRHLIAGDLFSLNIDNSAVWLDTISFAIVQVYLIFLLLKFRKAEHQLAD